MKLHAAKSTLAHADAIVIIKQQSKQQAIVACLITATTKLTIESGKY